MRTVLIALVLVACGEGAEPGAPRSQDLEAALEGRGRIVALDDARELQPEGAELLAPNVALRAALEGDEAEALVEALEAMDADGIALPTSDRSGVGGRLARMETVEGLRAAFLHPDAVLYLRGVRASLGRDVELAAPIARRLLEGAPRPPLSSFPRSFRQERSVEVMVLLRDRGRSRLWRSARGSSLASALLTASTVARQRWQEREQALGGALADRLDDMDVEVSLLEEDGTLASGSEAFVERAFQPGHGVAYESTSNWRYLLPEPTARKGEGSAVAAYHELFREDGLPAESLEGQGLRLYRLVVTPLGVDAGGSDGLRAGDALDTLVPD